MGTSRQYIVLFTFFILQFFCGSNLLFAQDPTLSEGGLFRVDYIKGCTPFTVTVTDNYDDEDENHTRVYALHDENGTVVKEFTNTGFIEVNTPGTYYVVQDIQTGVNQYDNDSIKVVAVSPDPVPFTITNCGKKIASIELIPEENTYTEFEIITRRPGQGGEVTPYTITEDRNGQFKGEIPFQGTGEYEISIRGLMTEPYADDGSCWETTFPFTVHEEIPAPELNQLQANIFQEEDTALLSHELLQNIAYTLEYSENGSGTSQPVKDISGSQTNPTEFIQFDFQENFYCFRAMTKNPCDQAQVVYSELICTAKLQVTPESGGNQIVFETGTEGNLEEARLLRKATTETNWLEIHSFGSANTETYLDSLIGCNTAFQYAIELVYAGGRRSITQGLPVSNEADRSLPAPVNITSNWQSATTVNFSIAELMSKEAVHIQAYRANDASRLVDEADTGFIALPAAGENTCYRFQYIDACGNPSAMSEPVCVIYLQNLSNEPDGLILEWNAYTGYADGVSYYELAKYDKDGNPQGRTNLGNQTTLDLGTQELEESGMQYEIIAYPSDVTIPPSTSNRFLFEIEMKGYFPNAFNPGSEGPNGRFTAEGKFVNQLHLQIFDRWGVQVFETTDKETGWNGTINGNPAPSGTYIYRAVVGTADNQQQTYQGAVFLMRR
jgi:gliding motility-associated-like protein